jgi:hypothetical protein
VGDVPALADRIARLLGDPDMAERMGHASLEIVRSTYSYLRMVRDHMCCYDEIIGRRRLIS